ncbi:DUF3231 family protein [Oceanobacillus halotolerans]|uniref:DUF3231 family protein n=1 Tax=Oceanobacillus halotolerans TaxID=2663380 RepID=UPI0013D2768F|nr:DUF3231 family protein [Oceanobacillus halotolerans]
MEHNPKLTSSEIANLWSSYMSDSMNVCVVNHFLNIVEDKEIEEILKHSKMLSEGHLSSVSTIFQQEKIPIPQGYNNTDVVENAPRIFSDIFFLRYLQMMGRDGSNLYGIALGTSYRKDVKSFYLAALNESAKLYDRVTNLMVEKGILVRTPIISYPDKVEFIQDENFMAGYLTPHKRPLLSVEITHISNNIESNLIGGVLITGFAQLAENEEVKNYFQKGIKLSRKIISSLSEILSDDSINAPFTWDSDITNSTISPFSDKLMMGMILSLNSLSTGNISLGISTSMRSDIVAHYTSLMAQIAKYTSSGAKLAIKNSWVEKPPHAVDRKKVQEKA